LKKEFGFQKKRKEETPITHHDQGFLHAKDDVAREVDITFWVQCRRKLAESRGSDHHVKVVRADVVSVESVEQLSHGALIPTNE
jgi:hypothetical protein